VSTYDPLPEAHRASAKGWYVVIVNFAITSPHGVRPCIFIVPSDQLPGCGEMCVGVDEMRGVGWQQLSLPVRGTMLAADVDTTVTP
jgi:hypothetical protein